MSAKAVINQGVWYVARENFKTHKLEYLDNERDLFYVEGVVGYTSKAEALVRVDKFVGDKSYMFIVGPQYGRYKITEARPAQRQSLNTQLLRFEYLDKVATPETVDELRRMLRDFALAQGVWQFSNIPKTKAFVGLLEKHGSLTDKELAWLVYDV